jgi:hypothetical protein
VVTSQWEGHGFWKVSRGVLLARGVTCFVSYGPGGTAILRLNWRTLAVSVLLTTRRIVDLASGVQCEVEENRAVITSSQEPCRR